MKDGAVKKFQPSRWMVAMEDEAFKARVLEVMDEEVVQKFDQRHGSADDFYGEVDENSLTDAE